jgi:asparagine synthase (glutamine-hydrolysing)
VADAESRGYDTFTAVALLDLQTYLVSILDRQDKMSMATSIEARVPFLDNEIVELALSFPTAFKQTLLHRKRVLKQVALRYLPAEIVHRRKSGFGVPLKQWFAARGPLGGLLDETLGSARVTSLLDEKQLSRLVDEHRHGLADHSEFLWSVLNLGLWRTVFGV